jgi:hypothetical protein
MCSNCVGDYEGSSHAAIGWRRGHDYTALWKPAEGPLTFDADVRQRVAMLIGSGDSLHELLQDAAARMRLNMKARQL